MEPRFWSPLKSQEKKAAGPASGVEGSGWRSEVIFHRAVVFRPPERIWQWRTTRSKLLKHGPFTNVTVLESSSKLILQGYAGDY